MTEVNYGQRYTVDEKKYTIKMSMTLSWPCIDSFDIKERRMCVTNYYVSRNWAIMTINNDLIIRDCILTWNLFHYADNISSSDLWIPYISTAN